MSKFPLYDNLSKNIKSNDLTSAQKLTFLKRVEKMDKNGCELIYVLIRMYQIENNPENTDFSMPYEGSFIDKDIIFDLDKLPNTLKQIIFKFLKVHLEKMKEESSVNQTSVKRV